MTQIIIFGAGGRAGRAAIAEARRRGHQVTGVVRDPARYADLPGPDVKIVEGDVTDAGSVAGLAQGHDAAVNAAADMTAPSAVHFPAAAQALVTGLAKAGVGRLVSVGLASVLETADGTPLLDTPGYPQEYRAFMLGHGAGTEVLRAADTTVDWVVLSPSGDFDHDGLRTGDYRVAPADAASRISYADFALAVLDEIDDPRHHRTHVGVEQSKAL